MMEDSTENGVFSIPLSFCQRCQCCVDNEPQAEFWTSAVVSLWAHNMERNYDCLEILILPLLLWVVFFFFHSHNFRQGFISFPSQHWPQPFHPLTALQNLFLTARNHLRWEQESLKSSGFLEAKSFNREKWSQGSLGNCFWVWEEKKEKQHGHMIFKFSSTLQDV